MIVGGDRAIEMPVKDLYNTQLMLASINAAKDIYDYGQKRMDDFQKTYGDFYSPIAKDVDYWYNNTTKPVKDAIDYLYANGIDPTRSAEGRSMIQRVIRNAPAGELAKVRQSAEAAKTYQKNMAILQAAGKYNPAYEDFRLKGRNLQNWDTSVDGAWTELSPGEYQTLHDFIDPVLDNIQDHSLTPDEAKAIFGNAYNPNHMYEGVTRADAERALANWQAGISGNSLYDFYIDQTTKQLDRLGLLDGKTDAERKRIINNAFIKNAVDSDIERWNRHKDLGMTKEAEYALKDRYDQAAETRQYKRDINKLYISAALERENEKYKAQLAGTVDANGNAVVSTTGGNIPYGAADELNRNYTNAENAAYDNYVNEYEAGIKTTIKGLNNDSFKKHYYRMFELATSGKLAQAKKEQRQWMKSTKAKTVWQRDLFNRIAKFSYARTPGNNLLKDFISSGPMSVNFRNPDGSVRNEYDVLNDALSKFNAYRSADLQDYGKDLAGLSPTIGSSTVSDDVHYTGLVAEATGSTDRGPSTNAIARRLDKALRHVQIQRVTNTKYGQGDINGLYRINGMDKGSAYFGTENVAIPITNKAVNDVLKDVDDDKLYKMGISKQQLGKNKAQYYIIPITKVNYNIDAVYSSGNSATRKRLGGTSNAYPSLGYDQNAGQNTFNSRRQ